MKYKLIVVVSVEDEESAQELVQVARETVSESLDLDKEDLVASYIEPE